jgi:hypothetical protein
MKKTLLIVLIVLLALLELYIGTAFLPMQWQHSINGKIVQLLPQSRDWAPITHPQIDQEIEQILREHIWLRISGYLFSAILLVVNAWLIRRVWRHLHAQQSAG